ncbi:MAG: hypothetical protein RLZZ543_438, partial [Bacteroidota bacterium]
DKDSLLDTYTLEKQLEAIHLRKQSPFTLF